MIYVVIILTLCIIALVWLGIEIKNAPHMCGYWYISPIGLANKEKVEIYICEDYRYSAEELEEDAY